MAKKDKKEKSGIGAEFKKFIMRGNVIDLAVGVIIGGAFQAIVNSLVNDIINPLIGLLTGRVNFSDLFIVLGDGEYETLAQAQEAGAATLNYGSFLMSALNFLIMAFVVFFIVKGINKIAEIGKKPAPEAAPTQKDCPFCKSKISIDAVKCPNCTSAIEDSASGS